MRSRGTFRFWKRAPSFTIGLTFRFADYRQQVFQAVENDKAQFASDNDTAMIQYIE